MRRLPGDRYIFLLLILLAGSFLWAADGIRDVTRTPWVQTKGDPVAVLSDFTMFHSAEAGQFLYQAQVELAEGDTLELDITVSNQTGAPLYGAGRLIGETYDYDDLELCYEEAGAATLHRQLYYSGAEHGEDGLVLIGFPDIDGYELQGIEVYRGSIQSGWETVTKLSYVVALLCAALCLTYALLWCVGVLRSEGLRGLNARVEAWSGALGHSLRRRWEYAAVFLIILGTLLVLYRHADLFAPLYLGEEPSDERGIFYIVHLLSRGEMSLVGEDAGGRFPADLYDYPYCEHFAFLTIRLLSFYLTDTYLITNLFYFLCYIVNGLAAVYVCRQLGIRGGGAVAAGSLFALSAFAQQRYPHMWLMPYFTIPLIVLLTLQLLRRSYEGVGRPPFTRAILWAFLCSTTGVYYAFFACLMVGAAMLIRFLEDRRAWRELPRYVLWMAATISGFLLSIAPSLVYTMRSGVNMNSNVARRAAWTAELTGLKLIRLLLPRPDHRLSFLGRILTDYGVSPDHDFFALVNNEGSSTTLGLIAVIGLGVAVVRFFSVRETREKKYPALLILVVILIAAPGGLGAIFNATISTAIRSYNRMVLLIAYLSLLCFAELWNRLFAGRRRWERAVGVLAVLLIGILDQTVSYHQDTSRFQEQRIFLRQVDRLTEDGSYIFAYPYNEWTSGGCNDDLFGPIETEGLHWSCAAIEGRLEAEWIARTIGYNTIGEGIEALRRGGYSGFYMDIAKDQMMFGRGAEEERQWVEALSQAIGTEPLIVSAGGRLAYWRL